MKSLFPDARIGLSNVHGLHLVLSFIMLPLTVDTMQVVLTPHETSDTTSR